MSEAHVPLFLPVDIPVGDAVVEYKCHDVIGFGVDDSILFFKCASESESGLYSVIFDMRDHDTAMRAFDQLLQVLRSGGTLLKLRSFLSVREESLLTY